MTPLTTVFNSGRLLIFAVGLFTSANVFAQATSALKPVSSNSSAIEITVTTSLNSQHQLKLSYPASVRVEQILADTLVNIHQLPLDTQHHSNSQIYWPAVSLYKAASHPLKRKVIGQLDRYSAHSVLQEEQQAIIALKTTLQTLVNGERLLLPLDYDSVRIIPQYNPLISEDLTLVMPSRPDSVLVLGATQQPLLVKWQERKGASFYLNRAITLDDADNSYAWVIQPDGNIEKHPIAYWNNEHMDIAPGAILYLSFSSLPSDLESLNQDIIELLRNSTL